MMSETVVTVQDSSANANNPRGPTIKTEPGQPSFVAGITINVPYFRTIPGIIKLVQAALGIICIAVALSWLSGAASLAFISTFIWIFVYLLSIRENLRVPINWILTELVNTSICIALYAIGILIAIIAVMAGNSHHGSVISVIFGIFNLIAYIAGTYFLWLEWKESQAQ